MKLSEAGEGQRLGQAAALAARSCSYLDAEPALVRTCFIQVVQRQI